MPFGGRFAPRKASLRSHIFILSRDANGKAVFLSTRKNKGETVYVEKSRAGTFEVARPAVVLCCFQLALCGFSSTHFLVKRKEKPPRPTILTVIVSPAFAVPSVMSHARASPGSTLPS